MKKYKCNLILVFEAERDSGKCSREETIQVLIDGTSVNNAEGNLYRAIVENEIPELHNKFFDELYFKVEEIRE